MNALFIDQSDRLFHIIHWDKRQYGAEQLPRTQSAFVSPSFPCYALLHECIVWRDILHYGGRYPPVAVVLAALDNLALRAREQLAQPLVVGRVDDLAPARVFVQGSFWPERIVVF